MAGSLILDSSGAPIPARSSPVRYIRDGVTEAIESASFGRMQQIGGAMSRLFAPQLAFAAYLESGMLQRVIELPAADRVREWRDWQADAEQIELLEAEERRLGLQGKIKFAEVLRGVGGGALIKVSAGLPSKPESITAAGQLLAVNVVSADQLQLVDIDQDMGSPTYGLPRAFKIGSANTELHPSRVVCFRGDPLPVGMGVSFERAFWGQSRLVRIFREVMRSDNAQEWFAALVKKAKLLRIGIPGLTDTVSAPGGQERLNRRMGAIAVSESVLNAVVYDTGDGKEGAGEKIDDYQINWNGIPAMMDAFDQRVAAISGIPFTVLQGRSPGGMNSTGDHDRQNWEREVSAGQRLELQPCLDQLDAALIPSALGSRPKEIWWQFAPLSTPTEAEEATRFKTWTEAAEKVQASAAIPDVAFNKAYQNSMTENGWMPGLDGALAEVPENERFGITPDPSGEEVIESSAGTGGNGLEAEPPRRVANDAWFSDATPRPLYVQRKLLNAPDLIGWAKKNGITSTLTPDDMHVTVLYSRNPVDPMKMGEGWSGDEKGNLTIKPGGPRAIERLGPDAVVLLFASSDLTWRHQSMVEAGASHDFEEYQPHVTLSYEVPADFDLDGLKPFTGELRFGPELFEALDLDWKSKVTEA